MTDTLPPPEGDRFVDALKFRRIGMGGGDVLYECWGDAIRAYVDAAVAAEREKQGADAERYRWLANQVLACDYGDNDAPGQQVGWRIAAKLCHGSGFGRQPAFMFGPSIDAAIDAAMSSARATAPAEKE